MSAPTTRDLLRHAIAEHWLNGMSATELWRYAPAYARDEAERLAYEDCLIRLEDLDENDLLTIAQEEQLDVLQTQD